MFRRFFKTLLLAAAVPALAPAVAGPIAISPTTVEIADGRRSAVIEIKNQDAAPVDLQFRAYAWTQAGGKDRLTPTDDVIVSPAIVTVQPGATQLFRVLQATPARADEEKTYRLRLNQIPRDVAHGVGINLEFLLPLFSGGNALTPKLRLVGAGGTTQIANDGGRHVKIGEIELTRPGGATSRVATTHATYILPSATMALPIGEAPVDARVQLTALGDRGPVNVAATTAVASR